MEFALDRFKMQYSRLVGLFQQNWDRIVLKCNAEGLSRADTYPVWTFGEQEA